MIVSFKHREITRYIDLSPNVGAVRDCVSCGKWNVKSKRVDTESIWGTIESYCLKCWWVAVRKEVDYKIVYRYLGNIDYV